MYHQLCLPLTDVECKHNSRVPREVPAIVEELFELDPQSPSGLVWRIGSSNGKAFPGKPAGSLTQDGRYYLVSVKGHGMHYAHRIVYYLQHKQNPGCMVVRHLSNEELVLGWQAENGQDEKGKCKKGQKKNREIVGSKTSKMYLYQDKLYNLRSLCLHLNLNYNTISQRFSRCKMSPEQAFELSGIKGVIACYE